MMIYNLYYSIPYLILGFIYLFFFVVSKTKIIDDNRINAICGIIFMFFFGLRGFVAYDWYGYYPFFYNSLNLLNLQIPSLTNFVFVGELKEPGFIIYTSFIKTFTSSWEVYIFISTLIDLFLLNVLFKKYSPYYLLSFLIFISFNISMEIDLLRNIKSLLIILLSIKYIKERKILMFLLLIFIAFLFHRSAIIFLPLYFIGNIKYKKSTLLYLLLIINLLYFSSIPYFKTLIFSSIDYIGGSFASKLNVYSSDDYYSADRGFTFGYFYRLFTYIILIIISKNIYKKYSYSPIFINMYLLYIIISFVFNDFDVFVFRGELILGISFCFLWPMIIDTIDKNNYKRALLSVIIIICFAKIYKSTSNIMYEYENILLGARSYEERISTHFSKQLR